LYTTAKLGPVHKRRPQSRERGVCPVRTRVRGPFMDGPLGYLKMTTLLALNFKKMSVLSV